MQSIVNCKYYMAFGIIWLAAGCIHEVSKVPCTTVIAYSSSSMLFVCFYEQVTGFLQFVLLTETNSPQNQHVSILKIQ